MHLMKQLTERFPPVTCTRLAVKYPSPMPVPIWSPMLIVLSLIVNDAEPSMSAYTVPLILESVILTPFARIVSEQSTVFPSMTVFAAVIVQGPVYLEREVPAGTPVLLESGKPVDGEVDGCDCVGVGDAVGVVVGFADADPVGVGVGVGTADLVGDGSGLEVGAGALAEGADDGV